MMGKNRIFQQGFTLSRQQGLSLIELMVAITIGLAVTIAAGAIYLGSKRAFSGQEQLTAIQQNIRLAFEYMNRDIRGVGYFGCATSKLFGTSPSATYTGVGGSFDNDFIVPIAGFEATGTTSGTVSGFTATPTASGNAVTDWTGKNPTAAGTINLDTALQNKVVSLSDVLVVRGPVGAPLTLAANQAAGVAISHAGVQAGDFVMLADCTNVNVVAATGAGAAGAPNAAFTTAAAMSRMQSVAYYVGLNNGVPTLFRRQGNPAGGGTDVPLIENVESMQVLYGEDTNNDDIADSYNTAAAVTSWGDVVSVRVGLLLRSPRSENAQTSAVTVNGVSFNTTTPSYDRRAVTAVITLRNRSNYQL